MKHTKAEQRQILLAMSEEERRGLQVKVCPRCGGTGHYSYNPMYGTMCFKCEGIGFVRDRRLKRKEGAK